MKYDELVSGWNVQNLGRPDGQAKVVEAIDSYANMMVEGSAAPAVIVRKTPRGFDVLDGCQRLHANEKTGSTHFAAYIIKCSDETARKIRFAANLRLNTAAPVDSLFVLRSLIDEFMVRGSDSARDIADVTGRRESEIEKLYKRRQAYTWVATAFQADKGTAGPELKDALLDTIADKAQVDDFTGDHSKVVVKFIDQLSACRFRNGDAIHHTEQFFGIKRIGSKNRSTQFRSKQRSFENDPIVHSRLHGGKKQTGVESVDTKLKALETVVKKYKKDCVGELDNAELVKTWDRRFSEIGRMLRECCSNKVRQKLDPFT